MTQEQLQAYAEIDRAYAEIARAAGLLDACEFCQHYPDVSLAGIAANLREVARLCMAAAHRLDPREEEGRGQIVSIHPET
jgi:hypothetical protein